MRRLILVLIALSTLVCAQQAPPAATPPKQVAAGSYGKSDDTWTLWADPATKQLRAEIEMYMAPDMARTKAQPLVQRETLRMDTDFTMRYFRYESKNFRGLEDGALACTVNPESLDCVSTFEKSKGKGRVDVSGGYATQFGVEIALLDLPWFFATLVAQSDRDAKQARTFGIVSLAFDGQTPDTLVTANNADATVKYAGQESIKILGRQVKAHRFEIDARHYPATVWTADSGLLLAVQWYDMRMELTRLRQWRELVPELPVEPEVAAASRR